MAVSQATTDLKASLMVKTYTHTSGNKLLPF